MESISCFCGAKDDVSSLTEHVHLRKEDENLLGSMGVYHCNNCGLSFVYPMPSLDALEKYYSDIYRLKGRPHYIKNPNKYVIGEYELSQVNYVSEFLDFKNIQDVLDVGAGYGFLLRKIRELFPEILLSYHDLDKKSTSYLSEYHIKTHIENNKYDLVMSSHNLEHFTSPQSFFNLIDGLLVHGGYLFIEVPNSIFETTKWKNRGYDGPHLMFFTIKSLAYYVELFGYEVIDIDTCGWSIDQEIENIHNDLDAVTKPTFYKMISSAKKMLYKIIPLKVKAKIKSITNHNSLDSEYSSYGGERWSIRAIVRKV